MSRAQEWESWKTPQAKPVEPAPQVGSKAPQHDNLPLPTDKPTIIVFLRHCGCPFAEKAFKSLTSVSNAFPASAVHCIAVSHSSPEATERWVVSVGGSWDVKVVVDEERELYSRWGLGTSNTWHVLSPRALYSVLRLGKEEGIWNRPTESGSRWQTSGAFAVDGATGTVKWAHVAGAADDLPDLDDALEKLGLKEKGRKSHDGNNKSTKRESVQTHGFL